MNNVVVGNLLVSDFGNLFSAACVRALSKNKNTPKNFRGVLVAYEIMETLKNLFRNFLDCRNHFATDVEGSGFALC